MQTDAQEEQRARYLAAMEAVAEASDRMIDALRDAQHARGIVREHMARGGRLSDLEHIIDPRLLRASVSAGLVELERTRHEAQRLLFQLLQAEGQTMTTIGRVWGISRQLVSRLIHESTDGTSA
jgi:DNA-directed RNA polymerase specialized sigma subunit